ncbi:hypothetical protein GEV33_002418 [Tenebrio molitor]|uniref:GPN-loop GTPase 2 n=1 Tax=Tenebrio molitor TaxID=7067 RepID=A0A8J6LIV1_TENMO|nr:hypothetical protein GEV33_002418 [Tenebrio molitor]
MDVSSLISTLSINDTCSNIFNFAANVNGHRTEFVIGTFTNQNLIIATQFEKLYSLYSVSVDHTENGICTVEPIYSVHQLFGKDNIYGEAAARFITKELNIRKQLLIFLSLKDYSRNTVKSIAEAIKNYSSDKDVGSKENKGSGKTTYCGKVCDFYKDKLNRKVEVVNLDPANENMNYKPAIDVMKLVTVEDVMDSLNLGPNGALMYCMEYLEENFDWLLNQLVQIKNSYLIFDMPGQVELYTHHNSIKNIFGKLEKIGYHLCAVHMVDSHYCSDPAKFISTLLLSLSTMMQIDVLNLDYLLDLLDDGPLTKKYKKLNAALIELIQDYSLVCFILLDVKSEKSLLNLKSAVDKANGYIYGSGEERSIQALLSCAVGSRTESERYDTDFF